MSIFELAFAKAFALPKVVPERQKVESKPERNSPFQDCCDILVVPQLGSKRDGEDNEDEGEDGFRHVRVLQSARIRAEFFVQPAELKFVLIVSLGSYVNFETSQ